MGSIITGVLMLVDHVSLIAIGAYQIGVDVGHQHIPVIGSTLHVHVVGVSSELNIAWFITSLGDVVKGSFIFTLKVSNASLSIVLGVLSGNNTPAIWLGEWIS